MGSSTSVCHLARVSDCWWCRIAAAVVLDRSRAWAMDPGAKVPSRHRTSRRRKYWQPSRIRVLAAVLSTGSASRYHLWQPCTALPCPPPDGTRCRSCTGTTARMRNIHTHARALSRTRQACWRRTGPGEKDVLRPYKHAMAPFLDWVVGLLRGPRPIANKDEIRPACRQGGGGR